MKRLIVIAAALTGAAAIGWAGPLHGQPVGGPAGGMPMQTRMQEQEELAARMDRLMNRMQELNRLMEQRQARAELRNMNQAMEETCRRLRTMSARMDGLLEKRDVKNDEACCREVDRFRDRMRVMTREMEEAGTSLRLMVEWEGKPDAAPEAPAADVTHVGEQQRDMERRMERLRAHFQDLNAWMVEKRSRSEFQETARDMEHVRDRLQTMLKDLIQFRQEGVRERDRLREMDRLQDRLDVMMREMMEAHESLTQLADAP